MDFDLQGLDPKKQMPETSTFATKDQAKFYNEPGNISGWQIVAKVLIGVLIGWIISALLFIVTTFMGSMISSAISEQWPWGTSNPMLSIILLFIGFLSTFIWNIAVAGTYNLFYSKKYYDGTKTFWLLLLTNGLLFFIFAPMYFIFSNNIQGLFLVLGFHIIFSVFASSCQSEFIANPNYAGSSFMGNIIGFAGSFLIYSLFYKYFTMSGGAENQRYFVMLFPPILAYALIPLGSGLREKIYYKLFYESGSNAFYIPSISEILENQGEGKTKKDQEEEINIEE
jgi:hypothetical protein